MGALQDHQQRIAKLRDGLNRLLQLHQRLYELHSESMVLAKAREPGHENKIKALRDEADAVHDEIAMLRDYLAAAEEQAPR